MNLVALLIAPVIISQTLSFTARLIITVVALGALAYAIMFSKRGSIADDQNAIDEATCSTRHGSEGRMEPPHLPPPPIHPSGGDAVADDATMHEVLSDDTVYAEPESKTGGCP